MLDPPLGSFTCRNVDRSADNLSHPTFGIHGEGGVAAEQPAPALVDMPHPILELDRLSMRQDLQACLTFRPAAAVIRMNEVLQRFPTVRVDLLGRMAEHHLHFLIAVDA